MAEFGAPTITIALAWVLSVRGRKGFGREREGGRKSVHHVGVNRDGGLTLIFDVGCSTPYFREKYRGGMKLVCYWTNLGVGNTMMSLKITENVIIKGLLANLGSWRWGPYGGPDL